LEFKNSYQGNVMHKVDILFTNAIVVTMDEQMQIFEPGAVAVSGTDIVDVGSEEKINRLYKAIQIVNCEQKVLMPGLINSHTHVPMTLLRGLADDLRLDVWLLGYMMPVEREFVSEDFVRLGTKLACAEMIKSGVTTFADMYYFEEDIAQATVESGMRAICSQTILKFPTPDAQSFEESLERARKFINKWKGHPLITPSVGPHAAYTCTDEILQAVTDLALEYDVPIHTHIAETAFEVENSREEFGMPVVPYVKKHRLLQAKVIAAHCVHIDEGEMRSLQHANASVAHNPSSNMKLASGIANVDRMIELGLNVGIGTDGTASNNDLDMFEEIRLAAFLSKVYQEDPTSLPARTALSMGTRMGAQTLHLGDTTGSLEPGKKADIILVEIDQLHNIPRFRRNPESIYAQLVYASKANDVTEVMVNGKWLMRDRELLTLNETELIRQSLDYAKKIDTFLIQREQSVLAKLIAIGGASEEESFEVQVKVRITETEPILAALSKSEIEIIRKRHYREYDSYFSFEDDKVGYLRYREDHFVSENNEVTKVRSRLTHIGPPEMMLSTQKVLLSRSRYIAPATQSLRFYREYFNPLREDEIEKDRLRYLVRFNNTEFFINIDTMNKPDLGSFLEIKSRTWSRNDAEQKSQLSAKLLDYINASHGETIFEDYIQMV
jgi:5-methylthioadenosine/S-adenosylhomocysteine deaminase